MARIDRVTFVETVRGAVATEAENRKIATSFVEHARGIEHPTRRAAALADALVLVRRKVSVRAAASLAGIASSTGLQRYFTIAAAVHDGKPVPTGYSSWPDAWAGMTLQAMVDAVRVKRDTTPESINVRAMRDVQRLVNMLATLCNEPKRDDAGVSERPFYISNLAEWLADQLVNIAAGEAPYWDTTKLTVVATNRAYLGTIDAPDAADDDTAETAEPTVTIERVA